MGESLERGAPRRFPAPLLRFQLLDVAEAGAAIDRLLGEERTGI